MKNHVVRSTNKNSSNYSLAAPFAIMQSVHKRMSEVLVRVPNKKTFTYTDGWNDAKIAADHDINVVVVTKFRRQEFGDLERGSLSNNPVANFMHKTNGRLLSIEERLAAIEEWLSDPQNKESSS